MADNDTAEENTPETAGAKTNDARERASAAAHDAANSAEAKARQVGDKARGWFDKAKEKIDQMRK